MQVNSEDRWASPGRPLPGPPPGPDTAIIDSALAGLDGLDHLDPADHVGRFDAVHSALTDALSSIDKV